jgi:hypothetical protein
MSLRGLYYEAFRISKVRSLDKLDDRWIMNWKRGVGRSGSGITDVMFQNSPRGTEEKHKNFRVTDIPTIRNEHIMNASPERYCYTSLVLLTDIILIKITTTIFYFREISTRYDVRHVNFLSFLSFFSFHVLPSYISYRPFPFPFPYLMFCAPHFRPAFLFTSLLSVSLSATVMCTTN